MSEIGVNWRDAVNKIFRGIAMKDQKHGYPSIVTCVWAGAAVNIATLVTCVRAGAAVKCQEKRKE